VVKQTLLFFCFFSWLGVTLDLYTTWAGITFFGCYETRVLGNIPLISYSAFIGLTLLFYWISEWMPKQVTSHNRVVWWGGKILLILIVLLPYYAALHNVWVISNVAS